MKNKNVEKNSMFAQNGITLIALIITIIILIILVAVVVSTALEGGIFDKADVAVKDTERNLIHEQILGLMELENNGKINVKKTYENAKDDLEGQGYTVTAIEPSDESQITDSIEFEVTGKKGTYKYKITGYNIEKIPENDDGGNPENPENPEEIKENVYYNVQFKSNLKIEDFEDLKNKELNFVLMNKDEKTSYGIGIDYTDFNKEGKLEFSFLDLAYGNTDTDGHPEFEYKYYLNHESMFDSELNYQKHYNGWYVRHYGSDVETTTAPAIQNVRIISKEELKEDYGFEDSDLDDFYDNINILKRIATFTEVK